MDGVVGAPRYLQAATAIAAALSFLFFAAAPSARAEVAPTAPAQSESLPRPDGSGSDLLDGDAAAKAGGDDLDKLMSMDLDQLTRVDIATAAVDIPTGTLTATTADAVSPYAVTHITRDMIEMSGARNLNELLDIFVPNLQVIRHHAHYSHVGIRGIISDREDKYLLRVNGRTMNQKFIVGADSERDLPLLRDMYCVDVVRGPASPTYGPGAIAGVINITTFNGLTFEGLDVQGRQVFEQYLTSTEIRYGKSLGEETGFFAYYGFADQPGADADDSPLINGRSGALPDGYPPAVAGQPAPYGYPNDEISNKGVGKHKVHLQYTQDTWDFWVRYTRGSYFNANQVRNMYRPPIGTAGAASILEDRPGTGGDYQQFTVFGSKVFEMSDSFDLTTILSYDFYDYVESRYNATYSFFPTREEEVYFRIMGQYTPDEIHALAIGYEHSGERFGAHSDLIDEPTRSPRLGFIDETWITHTGSIFGEYRVRLLDPLTVILAGRWDKHTYSDDLYSPRVSVMYDATDIDLLKFNIGQSVRKQGDEELRAQWVANGTIAEEEVLQNIELRWERRPVPNMLCAATTFYQHHDVVGFSGSVSQSLLLGTFESWGWEFEMDYDWDSTYFTFSQSYVKLLNGTLVDPTLVQGISAAPYGFGDDFANWSNNLTKLAVARDISDRQNLSSSLRVYWGFPGAKDLADYNRSLPSPSGSIAQADPDYQKAWRANVYLDFGYQERINNHWTWRVDLYNVLGWADIDLNKRNYINRVSEYRPEAAAVGVSATANF